METKHTPGAIRAARAITAQLIHTNVRIAETRLARMIDENTGAPDLLAACRSARSAIVLGNGRDIDWNAIADELQDAIAAATKPAECPEPPPFTTPLCACGEPTCLGQCGEPPADFRPDCGRCYTESDRADCEARDGKPCPQS